MSAKILIGTSGFGYSDWQARQEKTRLPFYPPGLTTQHRLSFYAEIFPTVEINTTFYHFPRAAVVNKWGLNVPNNFIFSYKIPRHITHRKKLDFNQGYWEELRPFLDTIQNGLHKKAGPALLQLPPKFSTDNFKQLSIFLKYWPTNIRLAVEFRHTSWVEHKRLDQTLELLSQYNAAYCIVDEPLLPPITPVTADFTYIRFHGHGLKPWYNYQYSLKELSPWVSKIQTLTRNRGLKEIFTYFNNHPHGSAPANARQLAILLKQPLKRPEEVKMVDVRKRVGDAPQHSLESFLDISPVEINDYVRFCSNCGDMILRDDNFCENCGHHLEKEL
ncbi:MAG: DUF72 domain-containing protein [Promethearchaeota archaeon]